MTIFDQFPAISALLLVVGAVLLTGWGVVVLLVLIGRHW